MIVEALKPLAVDIDSVEPDPRNARTGHAVDDIARSLKKYGQRKPIVVNRKTGNIEAGNGTWKAAKKLKWKKIAAVFVDDDHETAIGYGIADNRLTDMSEFDVGQLSELLADVDALEIPGVDDAFLNQLSIGDDEIPTSEESMTHEMTYQIIIECDSESEQLGLIEKLESEGVSCKPLIF